MEQTQQVKCSFRFKQFGLSDARCGMKIGTDGVLLGAWASSPCDQPRIADLGAGCGLISLMLAQRFPDAEKIDAVEIAAGAYQDLLSNVCSWDGAGKVNCINDTYTALDGEYDLIVSNPPFFTESAHSPVADRAAARHVTELSPLGVIRFASTHLSDFGSAALIMPVILLNDVIFEAELLKLHPTRLCKVSSRMGKPFSRALLEVSRKDPNPVEDSMYIADNGGTYTAQYKALTRDFYLYL